MTQKQGPDSFFSSFTLLGHPDARKTTNHTAPFQTEFEKEREPMPMRSDPSRLEVSSFSPALPYDKMAFLPSALGEEKEKAECTVPSEDMETHAPHWISSLSNPPSCVFSSLTPLRANPLRGSALSVLPTAVEYAMYEWNPKTATCVNEPAMNGGEKKEEEEEVVVGEDAKAMSRGQGGMGHSFSTVPSLPPSSPSLGSHQDEKPRKGEWETHVEDGKVETTHPIGNDVHHKVVYMDHEGYEPPKETQIMQEEKAEAQDGRMCHTHKTVVETDTTTAHPAPPTGGWPFTWSGDVEVELQRLLDLSKDIDNLDETVEEMEAKALGEEEEKLIPPWFVDPMRPPWENTTAAFSCGWPPVHRNPSGEEVERVEREGTAPASTPSAVPQVGGDLLEMLSTTFLDIFSSRADRAGPHTRILKQNPMKCESDDGDGDGTPRAEASSSPNTAGEKEAHTVVGSVCVSPPQTSSSTVAHVSSLSSPPHPKRSFSTTVPSSSSSAWEEVPFSSDFQPPSVASRVPESQTDDQRKKDAEKEEKCHSAPHHHDSTTTTTTTFAATSAGEVGKKEEGEDDARGAALQCGGTYPTGTGVASTCLLPPFDAPSPFQTGTTHPALPSMLSETEKKKAHENEPPMKVEGEKIMEEEPVSTLWTRRNAGVEEHSTTTTIPSPLRVTTLTIQTRSTSIKEEDNTTTTTTTTRSRGKTSPRSERSQTKLVASSSTNTTAKPTSAGRRIGTTTTTPSHPPLVPTKSLASREGAGRPRGVSCNKFYPSSSCGLVFSSLAAAPAAVGVAEVSSASSFLTAMERRAKARKEAREALSQKQAASEERAKAERAAREAAREARRVPFSSSYRSVLPPPPLPGVFTTSMKKEEEEEWDGVTNATHESCQGDPRQRFPSSSHSSHHHHHRSTTRGSSSLSCASSSSSAGGSTSEVEETMANAAGLRSWRKDIWEVVICIQQTKAAQVLSLMTRPMQSTTTRMAPTLASTASLSMMDVSCAEKDGRMGDGSKDGASRASLEMHDKALEEAADLYSTLSLLVHSWRRWREAKVYYQRTFSTSSPCGLSSSLFSCSSTTRMTTTTTKGIGLSVCEGARPSTLRCQRSVIPLSASPPCLPSSFPLRPCQAFREKVQVQQERSAAIAATSRKAYQQAQEVILHEVLLPLLQSEATSRYMLEQMEARRWQQLHVILDPSRGWSRKQTQTLRRVYFVQWAELGWQRKAKREAQLYRLRLEKKAKEVLLGNSGLLL